jgi:hypothetical protein
MPATVDKRELELRGALLRLKEIDEERNAILKAYPGLLQRARAVSMTAAGIGRRGGSRKGRKLSEAAKKRMSAGMRKWWAKRKATAR